MFRQEHKAEAQREVNKDDNKLHLFFESIEKRIMKIEDHLIGLNCTKPTTRAENISNNNFYTDILKNRISELEKQLS